MDMIRCHSLIRSLLFAMVVFALSACGGGGGGGAAGGVDNRIDPGDWNSFTWDDGTTWQ